MHTARCHCGNLQLDIDAALEQAIECNCSICAKKGYILAFVPASQVRLVSNAEQRGYRFHSMKIEHAFCAHCGCSPFGMGKAPDGTDTYAINLRCVDGLDLSSVKISPYDGRSL